MSDRVKETLDLHVPKDRVVNRCPVCKRKRTPDTKCELQAEHMLLLHYMRLIYDAGDTGYLCCDDATRRSKNKNFGSLESRKTGRVYRAPVKLARTIVRVLEAFGLVDYLPRVVNESGHRISECGLRFLDGTLAVPDTIWTLDGGVVRPSGMPIDISMLHFTPNPAAKIYTYP